MIETREKGALAVFTARVAELPRSDLTSSPLIDDVVQESLNVAVLINRGHNEIGSLPGTLPNGIGG